MKQDNVIEFHRPEQVPDALSELLRAGAQRLIEQAVEAEMQEYLNAIADRRDAQGRRAVVRNGHLPEREVLTGIGPVSVKVPKVCATALAKEQCFTRSLCLRTFAARVRWTQRYRGCICMECPPAI